MGWVGLGWGNGMKGSRLDWRGHNDEAGRNETAGSPDREEEMVSANRAESEKSRAQAQEDRKRPLLADQASTLLYIESLFIILVSVDYAIHASLY